MAGASASSIPRRFGSLDLVPTADEDRHRLLAGLGPEPLEPGFDAAVLSAALAGRRTADQGGAAGPADRGRAGQHLCLRGAVPRPASPAATGRQRGRRRAAPAGAGDPGDADRGDRRRRLQPARLRAARRRARLFPARLPKVYGREGERCARLSRPARAARASRGSCKAAAAASSARALQSRRPRDHGAVCLTWSQAVPTRRPTSLPGHPAAQIRLELNRDHGEHRIGAQAHPAERSPQRAQRGAQVAAAHLHQEGRDGDRRWRQGAGGDGACARRSRRCSVRPARVSCTPTPSPGRSRACPSASRRCRRLKAGLRRRSVWKAAAEPTVP